MVQFASYLKRVLCKTRLINGPIVLFYIIDSQTPLYGSPLIQTPHYYGQFALSLGEIRPLHFLLIQPA